jgi:hypothetical protein
VDAVVFTEVGEVHGIYINVTDNKLYGCLSAATRRTVTDFTF